MNEREDILYEALLDAWDMLKRRTVPSRSWSDEELASRVCSRIENALASFAVQEEVISS
jgi:hypothetical protein